MSYRASCYPHTRCLNLTLQQCNLRPRPLAVQSRQSAAITQGDLAGFQHPAQASTHSGRTAPLPTSACR